MGLPSLTRKENLTQAGEIGSSGLIHLRVPAKSIQSLFVAGRAVPEPSSLLTSPYVLAVGSVVQPYLTGGFLGTVYARLEYTVTFTGGWTAADLPEQITQAVLLTAGELAAQEARGGVTQERMGPVSYSYAPAAAGGLPDVALALLQPWLPLRF